jgi:pyrroline-5-carboxylate reductase
MSSDWNNIAIIGTGNIGSAVAKALSNKYNVIATRRNVEKIEWLKEMGCEITDDNVSAAQRADVILITVKPKDVLSVLSEIEGAVSGKIIVSFAAFVKINEMKVVIKNAKLVRAMTNVCAEIGEGFTAYFTTDLSDEEQKKLEELLSHLGDVIKVDEEEGIDVMTAFSGSMPAYIAKIVQSFIYAGLKSGLNADVAKKATLSVLKGVAGMLEKENTEDFIARVTTPGGTTIEGLTKLAEHGIDYAIIDAMNVTVEKARKS